MIYLLHHLLMDSASRRPDKDAVVFGEERITYGALDEITNKLAAVLRENGVRRGDRVGIYLNKSVPSIVSIHGIMKAGAVYVPLDPHAPPSRISYIMRDCGIRCLLTSTKKIEMLPRLLAEGAPLESVILTDGTAPVEETPPVRTVPWKDVTGRDDASLPESPTIETDLAYILYTSGSTGVPKGVMISHLNSLTFVKWACETFRISSDDRLSNHAPLHFDLSILDIFAAFKAGATVLPVPEGLSTFPVSLSDWIEKNRISIWYSVPSVLSMLVLHGKLGRYRFSNLRAVLFAGEVFPVKYLRALMEFVPRAEYFNLYGPTETNVITYYRVEGIPPDQTRPIPVGKTCANMEVFALTDDGKIVSGYGEEGELCARGSCVAQGYWGDPEKTKKSFVINPMQSYFQERIYKTGDLVTLDEGGNYLYIGRLDHMIKSRGYRIELGEIESVLYSHPEVKEAAAVGVPDELVGKRIKAFVVVHNKDEVGPAALRQYCSERIPHYMVPEVIELRDRLPKTSTGKIDKSTLMKEM